MRNRKLRRDHWSSSQAAAYRQLENISAFAFAELEDIHLEQYIILTTITGVAVRFPKFRWKTLSTSFSQIIGKNILYVFKDLREL